MLFLGGKKYIPSPVKFSKAGNDDDEDDDSHSMAVDSIIDGLEKTPLATPVKEDNYAVYLGQDEQEELRKAARDAARELQELDLLDFAGQSKSTLLFKRDRWSKVLTRA